MISFLTRLNKPLQETLKNVSDPIQNAQITVFYYVFLMNLVKIGVLIPGYIATQDFLLLGYCALGVCTIFVIIKLLLSKPEHLNKLIHAVLIIKITMLIGGTIFYNGDLTLLTIQDIFMVCMWSFYALKGKWGFHYAWIATIPLFYPIIVQGAVFVPLGMSDLSSVPFIMVLTINFFIIFFK